MLIGWSLSAVMGGALAHVTSHRTACSETLLMIYCDKKGVGEILPLQGVVVYTHRHTFMFKHLVKENFS